MNEAFTKSEVNTWFIVKNTILSTVYTVHNISINIYRYTQEIKKEEAASLVKKSTKWLVQCQNRTLQIKIRNPIHSYHTHHLMKVWLKRIWKKRIQIHSLLVNGWGSVLIVSVDTMKQQVTELAKHFHGFWKAVLDWLKPKLGVCCWFWSLCQCFKYQHVVSLILRTDECKCGLRYLIIFHPRLNMNDHLENDLFVSAIK